MTRSILSNWFGLLVLAGSTALLTPVMIHHLGAVDYGVWVLASSVLDYYGLLDLGMRAAMFRYVALFRGGSLRDEVDRTFTSALLLVTGTAVVICVLSVRSGMPSASLHKSSGYITPGVQLVAVVAGYQRGDYVPDTHAGDLHIRTPALGFVQRRRDCQHCHSCHRHRRYLEAGLWDSGHRDCDSRSCIFVFGSARRLRFHRRSTSACECSSTSLSAAFGSYSASACGHYSCQLAIICASIPILLSLPLC